MNKPTDHQEQSNCLASLALFRTLYDRDKDINHIIAEFVRDVIVSSKMYSFNLIEITDELNKTYDFQIPSAVVKNSLKGIDILNYENGRYFITNTSDINVPKLDSQRKELQDSNNEILDNLFKYIDPYIKVTEENKKEIVEEFISFLKDNENSNDTKYWKYISGFIVSGDKDFKNQLDTIKEGVILHFGIKYSANVNERSSWKNDLTIYLETEILFHMAGYNGVLYKQTWEDFYKLVTEINSAKNGKIKLKYFTEVKDEIEKFFNTAERIIEGNGSLNPKITAMESIVKGCKAKSEVHSKKTSFFSMLDSMSIYEDDYAHYNTHNNQEYNIADQNTIDKLSESLQLEDPYEQLKLLNYINIRRRGRSNKDFQNIEYILLSGNNKTKSIARSPIIKNVNDIPLSTTLDFITNKFWFTLNKGFSDEEKPISFDVITKAQIVLSKEVGKQVGKQFEKLQKKYKNNEITEEDAKKELVGLRKSTKKPEDIKAEDAEKILTINEHEVEHYTNTHELLKIENKKQGETILKYLQRDLKEVQEKITNYEAEGKRVEMLAKRKIICYISFYILAAVVFIALMIYIYYTYSYLQNWTWLPPIIVVLLKYIYYAFKEKTFNIKEIISIKKDEIRKKVFKQNNYSASTLDSLKKDKRKIEEEIEEAEDKQHSLILH